jgi:chemotaxis signal transduction protein
MPRDTTGGAEDPALRQRVLRERARRRALRVGGAGEPQAHWLVLAFGVGPFRFGLPLTEANELLPGPPLTPVPGTPPAMAGVFVLSGELACAFHLPLLLGLDLPAELPRPKYLLVLRVRQRRVGLPITDLEGLKTIRRDAIRPAAEAGLAELGASAFGVADDVVILDWPSLCRSPLLATL